MTALTGKKIRERIESDDLEKRLVVSPLLDYSGQLREDQASIDVRLGCGFALVQPSTHGAIDELNYRQNSSAGAGLNKLYKTVNIPLGNSIIIHPHQFILAQTLEYIRLPRDLMAYVVGRSTWGRLGLIVATAVGIHPGFSGCLTLELRNLGEAPLALYPGQTIAQLFFHYVDVEENAEGKGLGQYSGAVDILPKKISSTGTYNKLVALRKRNEPKI